MEVGMLNSHLYQPDKERIFFMRANVRAYVRQILMCGLMCGLIKIMCWLMCGLNTHYYCSVYYNLSMVNWRSLQVVKYSGVGVSWKPLGSAP